MKNIVAKRIIDLRSFGVRAAAQMNNLISGTWAKFSTGGIPGFDQKINKPSDVDVFSRSDIAKLFDRVEIAKEYATAMTKGRPAQETMSLKDQSDFLSSLQNCTIMRYHHTRIWSTASALSRLRASNEDIPNAAIELDFNGSS